MPFLKDYDKKWIRDFFDYWSEPNKSKIKNEVELNKNVGFEIKTNQVA